MDGLAGLVLPSAIGNHKRAGNAHANRLLPRGNRPQRRLRRIPREKLTHLRRNRRGTIPNVRLRMEPERRDGIQYFSRITRHRGKLQDLSEEYCGGKAAGKRRVPAQNQVALEKEGI